MAISTYSELKTAVASWIVRTDLTSIIPDFITLAEADIRKDVRCQAMETLTSSTLTGETLAHPTRYLEAKILTVGGYSFEYITPASYLALDDAATDRVFTSIGQSLYINDATSGDAYKLVYYAGFAAFSGASDTNWILTNEPDIYLSMSCRYAAAYMKDTEEEGRFAARYAASVARLNSQQQRSMHTTQLRVIAR